MNICFKFLSLLKVPFNKRTVTNFFNTHSNHPSILSLSDLLDEYNIENAAVRIGKENFNQIDTPFIAKTQSSEGDFCLIEKIANVNVTYLNEKDETITETLEQFYLQYSGVVLVAETTEQSAEPNYQQNKQTYFWQQFKIAALVSLLFALAFTSVILRNPNTHLLIVLFLKTLGIATSILLLIQSLDTNNPFINKLCSSSSGNGCNHILNSSAAKIFKGKLSWSEIGFFYFFSTFLLLVLIPFSNTITTISICALLAFPYTFYSIIYQYKQKQWCKLCLVVQAVLLLEFIVAMLQFNTSINLTQITIPLVYLLAILLLIFITWFTIKPLFLNTQKLIKLQKDVTQFKKDENIFTTLLHQQKQVNSIDEQYSFILGNHNANFEITFVSNPYCHPCAEAHKKLKALLQDEEKNIKLNIIFTVSSFENEPKNKVISQLIATYETKGANAAKQAMEEWYNTNFKNTDAWFSKYNNNITDSVKQTMEEHKNWCDENEVSHTPTLFINNYQYLNEYTFTDLKHFIHLAAKQNNVSTVSHI